MVNTTPYWDEAVSLPMLRWLDSDLHVDVGIIGGGIVGITAAYLLKAAGPVSRCSSAIAWPAATLGTPRRI